MNFLVFGLAALLLVTGMFNFLNGTTISMNTIDTKKELNELPLGEFRGIAVSEAGKVYCGVHFYSRIQVYDTKGKYLYTLSVNGLGGDFRLKIDDEDNLMVATTRNRMIYTFDDNGDLIGQREDDKGFDAFGEKEENISVTNDGTTYKITNPLLMHPRVTKTGSEGRTHTIISTGFSEWIRMGPFPAWLFAALGMGIIVRGYNKSRKRTEKRNHHSADLE